MFTFSLQISQFPKIPKKIQFNLYGILKRKKGHQNYFWKEAIFYFIPSLAIWPFITAYDPDFFCITISSHKNFDIYKK